MIFLFMSISKLISTFKKTKSSLKRKEEFHDLCRKHGVQPLEMIQDVITRWGSVVICLNEQYICVKFASNPTSQFYIPRLGFEYIDRTHWTDELVSMIDSALFHRLRHQFLSMTVCDRWPGDWVHLHEVRSGLYIILGRD